MNKQWIEQRSACGKSEHGEVKLSWGEPLHVTLKIRDKWRGIVVAECPTGDEKGLSK